MNVDMPLNKEAKPSFPILIRVLYEAGKVNHVRYAWMSDPKKKGKHLFLD